MKALICAGEPSGDARGAELLSALSAAGPVEAFGMGGEALARAGMEIAVDISGLSVMGFTDVLPALPRVLAAERALKRLVRKRDPEVLILVDFPGFNMRLGSWAVRRGLRVVQYIAPQVWAWGSWRARRLASSCGLLLVILPFEEEFFRNRGIRAVYTGHPLADAVPRPRPRPQGSPELALLPGSRNREVQALLPEMLDAFRILRDRGTVRKAVIAVSRSVDSRFYPEPDRETVLADGPEEALGNACAALVCSGTATLETAMYGVPQVICYRTGRLNYAAARMMVRGVRRIGLANLVAGADIAPELIQGEARGDRMARELSRVMADPCREERTALVRRNLGAPGGAARAAKRILAFLEEP
jgi:lipid-A-disaccharide synthase